MSGKKEKLIRRMEKERNAARNELDDFKTVNGIYEKYLLSKLDRAEDAAREQHRRAKDAQRDSNRWRGIACIATALFAAALIVVVVLAANACEVESQYTQKPSGKPIRVETVRVPDGM